MSSSLTTALGALQAHQGWLDVIGNNLANANTTGFKSSRALFSDLFSRNLRSASAPTSTLGGKNPMQVGLGVRLGSVDKILSQGTMDFTGRTFDLALLGGGHFAVTDGSRQYFTRVGSFGLDSNSEMVDLRSGYKVLSSSGSPFSIDTDTVIPPEATSEVAFNGNLPAEVEGPLAHELTSATAFLEGLPASLTGLATGPYNIPSGETWTMEIAVDGGAAQEVSIPGDVAPITAATIAAEIDKLDHVTATVEPTGEITLTTDKAGKNASIHVSPGAASQDLAGLLGLGTSLVNGSEFDATLSTDLSNMVSNLVDYANGDVIHVSGTDTDSSPVGASFVYGTDGTTIGELVSFIDGLYAGATAAFDDQTQQIVVTSDETGESGLSVILDDDSANTGQVPWAQHALAITTEGTGPDTVTSSAEVFDSAGVAHTVTFSYERQDDGTWTATASVPPEDGTISSAPITGITFDANGALLTPPSGSLQVAFTGQPLQTVDLGLGTSSGFDGLTQFGGGGSVLALSQDGFAAGELGSLTVNTDGSVDGVYTNGQILNLGQFGVVDFDNPEGLEDEGNGYLTLTSNSGSFQIGAGATAGAGDVVGGALEESNVDQAQEFVRLIQAQRGFQANARVISTVSDLLAEVVNLV